MTKTTTVLLSTEKLIDLGSELTDIMNSLEMNNLTLEALEITQKVDTATFNWIAKKYIETAYAQNEKLYQRLDKIAFLLLNNDKPKELEALNK
ncbi:MULTISPECIES: hypothetical protein [Streptococcus]|jgi:hypothetical protein|uniref:hypothetical protein n=1 Tax=Streptococcus TaxID=1301 RepID=UPI0008A5488D|nr:MULTISPECIES: hypothetical protein [Streptococcus]OFN55502.1 hypothetical protein HMPREF2542_08910 [Streptococcus sp. HMSC034B05]PMR63320.1 hypothetical protein C1I61_09120 [Streptococcus intermedius]WOI91885.1 hypothetical protein RYQ61_03460 [Streptococcus intermedius]